MQITLNFLKIIGPSVYAISLVAKILIGKLKKLLPKLISEEYGAFVSSRSILDNILQVQEILHSMLSSEGGGKLMGLKVDMERLYDHFSWDFVELVQQNWFSSSIFAVTHGLHLRFFFCYSC